jgi:hypothetical protein
MACIGTVFTEVIALLNYRLCIINMMPIPVAARSKAWVCGRLVRNPLRAWMFVSCVSVLCCPVKGEAFATG